MSWYCEVKTSALHLLPSAIVNLLLRDQGGVGHPHRSFSLDLMLLKEGVKCPFFSFILLHAQDSPLYILVCFIFDHVFLV